MKTQTPRRYDAIENDGYYTLLDGTRVETDEIAVYGIESSPHTLETDPDACEIGSMLVKETGDDWRDATEDELAEINDDRAYMEDLVWSIVKELTQ
ncbi:hypothetical protein N9251_03345 [Gammaproteobacteria bacterium]|nr:hypothetical protein [Gammaproteobacteria bacterium]